jgi:hypothetical protein
MALSIPEYSAICEPTVMTAPRAKLPNNCRHNQIVSATLNWLPPGFLKWLPRGFSRYCLAAVQYSDLLSVRIMTTEVTSDDEHPSSSRSSRLKCYPMYDLQ